METSEAAFFHVRIIIGIITGLGLTRLLTGLARFVQHPTGERIYPIHLGWALFVLLSLIHFWWFQFGLSRVVVWTFEHYFFVIAYAALFFFTCAILFPDRMDEYSGFEEYFTSRRRWFFGLLAALAVVDVIDTAYKGAERFAALGPEYPIRQALLLGLAVVAMFVSSARFHAALVVFALTTQTAWILWRYAILD